MKKFLTDTERNHLDQLIKVAEDRTKSQIVLAVINRCDNYVEIPWKAFAISSSITGMLLLLYNLLLSGWVSNALILVTIVGLLASGAFFALLTVLLPGFARFFLSDNQAETETRQYAESLFFNSELFATEGRTGLLLLVSQFERQVVILKDKGVSKNLSVIKMDEIITMMTVHLKHKEVKRAMETGLEELIKVLETSASEGLLENELSNQIIEEEGL